MIRNSTLLSNADNVINDAFRKGAHLSEMISKNHDKDAPAAFVNDVLGTIKELGGVKLKLSEDKKIRTLNKINDIMNGKCGFDVTNAIDIQNHGRRTNRMQLADPQGSMIGNYTLQLAMMYIIEFGSNLDQGKFELRKYFPDTPSGALETMIDRGAAVYGRLNAADYNMPMPIRTPMNSYAYKYEAVRYGEQVQIMPRDMLF